jgi:MinD-like ATPase involved in chromosome partitioning or flagellar assembly
VNQGTPVDRISPNSAITKALREFAAQLAPEIVKGRGGWFSGLLRGGSAAKSKGSEA